MPFTGLKRIAGLTKSGDQGTNSLLQRIGQSERAQRVLHKIFAYNLVDPRRIPSHALVGAVSGGGIGASTGDSKHKLRNILSGSVVGAVGVPSAPFITQRGVGRIVTNLVTPHAYDLPSKIKAIRTAGLKKSIMAVLKDKPIYTGTNPDITVLYRNGYTPREVPYRAMFGMKPREYSDFFNNDKHTGLYRYRRGNPAVEYELERMTDTMQNKNNFRYIDPDETLGLLNTRGGLPGNTTVHMRSGRFVDDWDLNLNKGEHINQPAHIVRGLMGMITKPVRITARMALPDMAPEL